MVRIRLSDGGYRKMRPSVEIELTATDRSALERLARGRKIWRLPGDRAQIVLPAARGLTRVQIGSALDITDQTARKWHNRFAEHRPDDAPRSGRPRRDPLASAPDGAGDGACAIDDQPHLASLQVVG